MTTCLCDRKRLSADRFKKSKDEKYLFGILTERNATSKPIKALVGIERSGKNLKIFEIFKSTNHAVPCNKNKKHDTIIVSYFKEIIIDNDYLAYSRKNYFMKYHLC